MLSKQLNKQKELLIFQNYKQVKKLKMYNMLLNIMNFIIGKELEKKINLKQILLLSKWILQKLIFKKKSLDKYNWMKNFKHFIIYLKKQ